MTTVRYGLARNSTKGLRHSVTGPSARLGYPGPASAYRLAPIWSFCVHRSPQRDGSQPAPNQRSGAAEDWAARQSVRPAASRPAAARSVPVGRSRPEPAVPSAAGRPRHVGTWPDWISAPAMRSTGPVPMMSWPGHELAPRRAPSTQAFGAQGGSGRRNPSGPCAPARSRRRRTGPAQADRLHQRQKSAVKLQI